MSKYKGSFFFHVFSICKFLCKRSYMILYTWVPSKTCLGHHCFLIPPHGWFRYIRSTSNLQNHEHSSCGETCDGCDFKFSRTKSFLEYGWLESGSLQSFEFVEMFAGKAMTSTCIQNSGRRITKLDIDYFKVDPAHPDRSNHYDILTHSGFLFLFSS